MFNIVDQKSDTNHQELYRIFSTYPPPDFVKAASFEDVIGSEGEELPITVYAYPPKKMFPFHNQAATWVSTAFLMDKKAEMDKNLFDNVARRLYKAADYFGITSSLKLITEKEAENKEPDDKDLPDSDFAIIENGERHLRLLNGLEVKVAAVFLNKHKDKFNFYQKQAIAEKIRDKANAFGTDLGEKLDNYIEKQAGIGSCPTTNIVMLLYDRAKKIGKSELRDQLTKMADTLSKTENANHPETLFKVAAIIDQIDKEVGLDKLYDTSVVRPENVLFEVTNKVASEIVDKHFSMTTGNIYKTDSVKNLKVAELNEVMGLDFTNRVSVGGLFVDPEKFAEEAHTLPRGDAKLLDKILSGQGIKPHAKEASDNSTSISKEDLKRLAEYHKARQTTEKTAFVIEKPKDKSTNKGMAIASLAKSLLKKI